MARLVGRAKDGISEKDVAPLVAQAIADDDTVVQAAATAVTGEIANRDLVTKAEADDLYATSAALVPLTPGPGEVIVGGADGTVSIPRYGMRVEQGRTKLRISDINSLALRRTEMPTTWQTPDGTGVIVHPSVAFVPEGWNGSQWWAAMTPYLNEDDQLENPCILTSNDGYTWTDAPGVTNPLAPAPGSPYFHSDPCLLLSPSGEMLLFYRLVDTQSRLRFFRSRDGVTWNGPTEALASVRVESSLTCPAIWYSSEHGGLTMMTVHTQVEPRIFHRWTAPAPEGPWTRQADPITTPANISISGPWHMEVRRVGDELLMLVEVGREDKDVQYIMRSGDDGRTWGRADAPVAYTPSYKSSFVPTITETGIQLDTFFGSLSTVTRGALELPRGERIALREGLASVGAEPYIFGDNFNRADNASLGTSSSGGVWTSGAVGISGNAAFAASITRASVDVGVSDYEIGAHLMPVGAGGVYLLFRYVDANNFIRLGINTTSTGAFALERVTGGVTANIRNMTGIGGTTPYRVSIRAVGSSFTAFINGRFYWEFTEIQAQTSTLIGLQISGSNKVDNIWCKRIEGDL